MCADEMWEDFKIFYKLISAFNKCTLLLYSSGKAYRKVRIKWTPFSITLSDH